jgi:ATP-dependent Clp protease adaptor protein ClpS
MESRSNTAVLEKLEYKTPGLYAVTLYNDEVTTMEFVVELLVKLFDKSTAEASTIMMNVHQQGKGVAGIYTYDIAVTKKIRADQMSSEKGYPLRLEIEEERGSS